MYQFNPDLKAKATLKERGMWAFLMGLVFLLLYSSANQFSQLTAPHPTFFMEWEREIPFISGFIIPYMSLDLMFVIAFLLPYTRLELRVLALRVLFIVLISVVIFILFPLQYAFPKPTTDGLLFELLKKVDLPFNQLPSLHISFIFILFDAMKKHLPKILKYFVLVWFLLIALSTLLVYQHHFIDIPTGTMVGLLAIYLIREDNPHFLLTRFTTPRSLKIGIYYFIFSILLMLLTFALSPFFFWIFLTLFSVSIIYAFGFNDFIAGKKARATLGHWLIFAPYFIGHHFYWMYYKSQFPLFIEVEKNLYLGRYPTRKEYNMLKENKIQKMINLATEQQLHQSMIDEIRLPYLNQTIQSPKKLHEGVLLIEKYKNKGLFVHCALGLSCSILLIGAWRLYQGDKIEVIYHYLKKMQPECIKLSHMQINLELYEKWLINQ